jgi:hypothetical protein
MAGKTVVVWSPVTGDLNLTAALINEILGSQASQTITNITTVGNGTLTAAGLTGGIIARTGPTGAYSDATDTAANIVTALGGFEAGQTFLVQIKNATGFTQTITAGTGVTLSATTTVPSFSAISYLGTVGGTAASPTVTLTHVVTVPIRTPQNVINPQSVALTTAGAGTITAGGIDAGITLRSGPTGAFADTTDLAASIITACPGLPAINSSITYRYVNNSAWPATIGGGTGVTVSGITVVPANSWAEYLITYTAAATLTMVGVEQGYFPASGSFVVNGVTPVTIANAAVTAGSNIAITLKTVGGTVGAIPHVETITPGTGFTIIGTASDSSTYNYEIRG